MSSTIELPLWLFFVILLFAVITFASHFLFPSVRWFFRRRFEKAVARLNKRLERPIEPFKLAHRHDMIQRLIYNPSVIQAVADHARETGVPENVAFEQAKRYAREIVPSFSATAYFGFAIRVARFLANALFRVRQGSFDEQGLAGIDKEATVVFIINHRSNMDYVLVTYLAAERSALSYAVGEWARVWPLSRLIRAMGAYFIRRRSRDDLYRRVLAQYVRMATDAGVTQAIFPEGGLSLTGELMPPKMGLLKYIVDGAATNNITDVVFVPVALNYDRVLEDTILIEASGKAERRFRAGFGVVTRSTCRQLWLRIRGKFHKFGYAAVSFGAPVSLADFQRTNPGAETEVLAEQLMQQIGQIVPILPVPLVAWLLTTFGAQDRLGLTERAAQVLSHLERGHLHLPRGDLNYAIEFGLRNLSERQIIRESEGQYHITPEKAEILAFYANSVSHLLKP